MLRFAETWRERRTGVQPTTIAENCVRYAPPWGPGVRCPSVGVVADAPPVASLPIPPQPRMRTVSIATATSNSSSSFRSIHASLPTPSFPPRPS